MSKEALEKKKERTREYMRKHRLTPEYNAYMREYRKLYRSSLHGKDTILKQRRRLYAGKIATTEGLQRFRAERLAEYYSAGGQARYRRALLKRYGLTPEGYEALFEAQSGLCAICRRDDGQTKHGMLHVDHDHDSGRVRGLLCSTCNTGIGHLGDDIERVKLALAYLEKHRGSI